MSYAALLYQAVKTAVDIIGMNEFTSFLTSSRSQWISLRAKLPGAVLIGSTFRGVEKREEEKKKIKCERGGTHTGRWCGCVCVGEMVKGGVSF